MKIVTILVGPPGSGKSTLAKRHEAKGAVRVNQDSQGPEGHLDVFYQALESGVERIVIDRMNFNVQQRSRYVPLAKLKGYHVHVQMLCESHDTCFARVMAREGHETITDERGARAALKTFFTKFEPPTEAEGIDSIDRIYPETIKPLAIYSDLDGTLCDVEHRRHHVRRTDGEKKDWKSFFEGISQDPVVRPVMEVLRRFQHTHAIVYCTGRDDNYRRVTQNWLIENDAPVGPLYMRHRNDSRPDFLVKEILLDFEVLTRYKILFALDDRDQVVQMLRRRGITVFQVAEGNF